MASLVGCGDPAETTDGPDKDVAADTGDETGDTVPKDAAESDSAAGPCTTHKDCADANEPAENCRIWFCDTDFKQCFKKFLPDDVACDDGKPCTNDSCKAGDCNGVQKTCNDDNNSCTVDACLDSTGACANTAKADGASCDDGELCTSPDVCTSGKCVAGSNICGCTPSVGCKDPDDNPCTGTFFCEQVDSKDPTTWKCSLNPATVVTCKDTDNNQCTATKCDPATGQCASATDKTKTGKPCDDGVVCTEKDTCNAGKCEGDKAKCCEKNVDCASEEDGKPCNGTLYCKLSTGECKPNPATVVNCPGLADTACLLNKCDESIGKCKTKAVINGGFCSDGNKCTGGESCKDGKCTGGDNVCVCGSDSDCAEKDDDTVCNGILYCNKQFIEKGKVTPKCEVNPATVVTCPLSQEACKVRKCDAKDGKCKLVPLNANNPCQDGNPCTQSDSCDKAGKCGAGANTCACEKDADCGKFQSANKCAGTLFCDASLKDATGNAAPACVINPTTIVTCVTDGNSACEKKICDPGSGKCSSNFIVFEDTSCDDGDVCTQANCKAGKCKAHTDLCQCHPKTAKADCDALEDGSKCNGTLFCDLANYPFKCQVNKSTVVECPTVGDSYCRKSVCEAKTGKCLFEFLHVDEPCDDKNKCTGGEVCKEGLCAVAGINVANPCDDGNSCTTELCDKAKGCVIKPQVGLACTDNDKCTDADKCDDKGACSPGKELDCKDKNACTTNLCHPKAGCYSFKNSELCEDGDACTLKDTCAAGKCGAGAVKTCTDNKPCTHDTCNAKTGACSSVDAGAAKACDDGVACTKESCSSTSGCSYQGVGALCDDGQKCTADTCVVGAGCQHTPNHAACDKGEPCKLYACQQGVGCKTTAQLDGSKCSDSKNCTFPDACKAGTCSSGPKIAGCDIDPTQCKGKADGTVCNTGDKCSTGECVQQTCRVTVVSAHVKPLAGNNAYGFWDGRGTGAYFNGPYGVAVGPDGTVYVSETGNHAIRTISTSGQTRLYAGNVQRSVGAADGAALAAQFNKPNGLALDSKGGLYVADWGNQRLRWVSPGDDKTRFVKTIAGSTQGFADGKGAAARFNGMNSIAMRPDGAVAATDHHNHRVRLIKPDGTVTTLAGTGVAVGNNPTASELNGTVDKVKISYPVAVAVDKAGNVYVGGHDSTPRIQRIDTKGNVTVIAGGNSKIGDGKGAAVGFTKIWGLTVDPHGVLWAVDSTASGKTARIRTIMPDGNVKSLYNKSATSFLPGPLEKAGLYDPKNVAFTPTGDLVMTVLRNYRVVTIELRKHTCDDGKACTNDACDAQTGKCVAAPKSLCDGSKYPCHTVTCAETAGGTCKYTNKGDGVSCDDGLACTTLHNCHAGWCMPAAKVSHWAGSKSTTIGSTAWLWDAKRENASFISPRGLDAGPDGSIWVADSGNHAVRRIPPSGEVETVAGSYLIGYGFADGKGLAARFYDPYDVAVHANGDVYVADSGNNRIRRIDKDYNVTTVAGTGTYGFADGQGNKATFRRPRGLTFDGSGVLYISDFNNYRIRTLSITGEVKTLSGISAGYVDGPKSVAKFKHLTGMDFGPNGALYVADAGNSAIRRVTSDGAVVTVAGSNGKGYRNGDGTLGPRFANPQDVQVDGAGNIYLADQDNHRIRVIYANGRTRTLAGGKFLGKGTEYGTATGVGGQAKFYFPSSILLVPGGLLVADTGNHRIKLLELPKKKCDDGNACTADACNNGIGCVHSPLAAGAACSDGSACTLVDVCNGGKCTSSAAVAGCKCKAGPTGGCDDGNACTVDKCDAKLGCFAVPAADLLACNDGNACTTGEACHLGDCKPSLKKWVVHRYVQGSGRRDGHRIGISGGKRAQFQVGHPRMIQRDAEGNLLIADAGAHAIRKLDKDDYGVTVAGAAENFYFSGNVNGFGSVARFYYPHDVAADNNGNIYVADKDNHLIRKIVGRTVTTLAGSIAGHVDGKGSAAKFHRPTSLDSDPVGNLFVADYSNCAIRRVSPDGTVTTLVGKSTKCGSAAGSAVTARVYRPHAIRFGADGLLYIANGANVVQRMTTGGVTEILVGHSNVNSNKGAFNDGYAPHGARFNSIQGIDIDQTGNIYLTDSTNRRVRMVTAASKGQKRRVLTIAGNGKGGFATGVGDKAQFDVVTGVEVIGDGELLVADGQAKKIIRLKRVDASCDDANDCTIDKCDPKVGCANTAAKAADMCKDGGVCSTPTCDVKVGVCVYKARPSGSNCGAAGECHKQCYGGDCMAVGAVTNLAGTGAKQSKDGPPGVGAIHGALGLALNPAGGLWVADHLGHRIRAIAKDGTLSTYAGSTYGYAEGKGKAAKFYYPWGLAADKAGTLYVADSSNHRIRQIIKGSTSTIGGGAKGYKEGTKTLAKFSSPRGLGIGPKGLLYIADTGNRLVRTLDPTTAKTAKVAGVPSKWGWKDGPVATALFGDPYDVAVDKKSTVYVVDRANSSIRKVEKGIVTTLAGNSSGSKVITGKGQYSSSFSGPEALILLPDDSLLVADRVNNAVRRVWQDGSSSVVAGFEKIGITSNHGYNNGHGAEVKFYGPIDLLRDPATGKVYVSDYYNNRVRLLDMSLTSCADLRGISKANAGKSCKAIKPVSKYDDPGQYWIDPDGSGATPAFRTHCDMKTEGGGWTRVDSDEDPKAVEALRGKSGKMMIKCSDGGDEYIMSPASSEKWSWVEKTAVAGKWTTHKGKYDCGNDKASFDKTDCGWGWGCSAGGGPGDTRVLPGVIGDNKVCGSNQSSAHTNAELSICAGAKNYTKWRTYIRTDD